MTEHGKELMPFVSAFCGSPSTYLWKMGAVHEIQQGEGGATLAIAAQLLANEKLFAFHDDMCRAQPGSHRVGEVACEAPGSVGPQPRRQRLAISMALVFLS